MGEITPQGDPTPPDDTADDRDCYRWLRHHRYPTIISCPHCGGTDIYRKGFKPSGARNYQCLEGDHYFSDATNTPFTIQTPITKLFYIIREHPERSDSELARAVGIEHHTVGNFLTALAEDDTIDTDALRHDFATTTLIDPDEKRTDADTPSGDDTTMIPLRPDIRDRLRNWKHAHDATYDEAITTLLDTYEPAGATPYEDAETIDVALEVDHDDVTYVSVPVRTRNRLRVWQTRRDLTYSEAITALLNTQTPSTA